MCVNLFRRCVEQRVNTNRFSANHHGCLASPAINKMIPFANEFHNSITVDCVIINKDE